MTDKDIWRLNRGGHDPHKVYAAYHSAMQHTGSPTVILAKTIKGYGMGKSGESINTTHQQKKLDEEDLLFCVSKDPAEFSSEVSMHMIDKLDILQSDASEEELLAILSEGKVAIIYEEQTFIGFITKVDLINYYRNKLN